MIPWDTFKTPQDAYEWAKALEASKQVKGYPIPDREFSWFVWINNEFGGLGLRTARQ